mgnify:FL=1
MADKKEMTTLNASVGADAGQSSKVFNEYIITHNTVKFNDEFSDCEENSANIDQIIQRMNDPSFMPVVSMEDIYGMVFSPKEWIIKGILRSGLYILAGAPKVGKSFLVGQISYHVSTGRPLWGYPVHRSPVLYMALEDDHHRLQERMFRMFGLESTKDLYFSISAKNLREGLEEQIAGFVKDHPGTRLIIIDTLKKIRPGDDDTYSYARDYADMTQLKKIADDNGICLLLVHHTRKKEDESDAFNTVSGTNGLTGAADGSFIFAKKRRTDSDAVLQFTGRDLQDQLFYLSKNRETLTWELDRVEVEDFTPPPDPVLIAVSQIVTADTPQWSGSPTELAEALSEDISPIALTKHLNVNAGRLQKDYSIQYRRKTLHEGRRIFLEFIPTEN